VQQLQDLPQPQVIESGQIVAVLLEDHAWHSVDPATITFSRTSLGNICEFVEPGVGAILTTREHMLALRFSH
jgi:hypothetical protein